MQRDKNKVRERIALYRYPDEVCYLKRVLEIKRAKY